MKARSLAVTALVLTTISTLTAFVGCATTSAEAQRGEGCSVSTDCASGLVCVPQKSGGRVCSDDLSGVLGKPPASGADAAGDVDAEITIDAASTTDADGEPSGPDGSGIDAAPPDHDAAPAVDAAPPEHDAAPEDAGEAADAGDAA